MRFHLAVLVAAATAVAVGCGGGGGPSRPAGSAPGTYLGPPAPFGSGTARSFITFEEGGRPTACGVLVPESAINTLPSGVFNEEISYFFNMPPEASVTPVNHVELRYWPMGHAPVQLFTTAAHVDFLFFTLSPDERD